MVFAAERVSGVLQVVSVLEEQETYHGDKLGFEYLVGTSKMSCETCIACQYISILDIDKSAGQL